MVQRAVSIQLLGFLAISAVSVLTFVFIPYYQIGSAFKIGVPGGRNKTRLAQQQSTANKPDHTGAVSSEVGVCSRIGTNILENRGNAADSLIATTFCIGVIAVYHGGIGGGGFALVRSSKARYEVVDFRETAPAAAFEDMFKDNEQLSLTSGLASGVPGELRGLEYIHKKYATMSWRALIEPSIKLARDGFVVTQDLVDQMGWATEDSRNFFVEDPSWAVDFAPNGTQVRLGDIMTRKRYAKTLSIIADKGADAWYRGPLAESTIKALQADHGTMTLQDLANYRIQVREPVTISYRGYRIASVGAPGGGAVMLSAMKIIEGYTDIGQPSTINISTHRFVEAFKFAYGQRAQLGDPSYNSSLVRYQEAMLTERTAAHIRSLISDTHTLNLSVYNQAGFEILPTPGTSHIAATDKCGMALSLTTTTNGFFGSQLMTPDTGVVMNAEMNDFSIPGTSNQFGYIATPANFIRPGKRPLSSMSPTIIDFAGNSSLYLVVGAAGGSRIIASVAQSIWGVLDRGMTAPESLAQPRFHDQLLPDELDLDDTFDEQTAAFLRARGHNVTFLEVGYAQVEAVRRLINGTFEAASEPSLVAAGGFAV